MCGHFPDRMDSPHGELIHRSSQSPLDHSLIKSCTLFCPHVTDEETMAQKSKLSALNPWLPPMKG